MAAPRLPSVSVSLISTVTSLHSPPSEKTSTLHPVPKRRKHSATSKSGESLTAVRLESCFSRGSSCRMSGLQSSGSTSLRPAAERRSGSAYIRSALPSAAANLFRNSSAAVQTTVMLSAPRRRKLISAALASAASRSTAMTRAKRRERWKESTPSPQVRSMHTSPLQLLRVAAASLLDCSKARGGRMARAS